MTGASISSQTWSGPLLFLPSLPLPSFPFPSSPPFSPHLLICPSLTKMQLGVSAFCGALEALQWGLGQSLAAKARAFILGWVIATDGDEFLSG